MHCFLFFTIDAPDSSVMKYLYIQLMCKVIWKVIFQSGTEENGKFQRD